MKHAVRFAVVVPVARPNHRLARCLEACSHLAYESRTILVVSDEPVALPPDPHFINFVTYSSSVTSPGAKRDFARHRFPDADVYAYLDDDAYPPPQWLDEAAAVLAAHPHAAGAGGPGLMPDDQTYWERMSAAVMEMKAGSGPLRFRFWGEAARDCDDFPAFNLFVRKAKLDAAGGWATNWYGGEDSALCARLAENGGLIRYDPRLAVSHYRRRLFPDHAWQIWNVGRSRGCLIRIGDPYSRRLMFAGPLCFLAGALALLLAPQFLRAPAIEATAALALACLAFMLLGHPSKQPWNVRLMTPLALLIHHGAYAVGIVTGVLTGKRTVREWSTVSSDPALGRL